MLEHAGLSRARGGDTGRLHSHFTGPPDELPKGDGTYGTSIPFEYGVSPAHDVLLAQGESLSERSERSCRTPPPLSRPPPHLPPPSCLPRLLQPASWAALSS